MMDELAPVRRSGVGGPDNRTDGISDLLLRAEGATVLDVGCNRGHVLFEFYRAGARLVHGCDIYAPGVQCARHWFAELASVRSRFEVTDLEKGIKPVIDAFGGEGYDIVLFLGVLHKLKRTTMTPAGWENFTHRLGKMAHHYFAWSGEAEDLPMLDRALAPKRRLHTSELAKPGWPAAIWG